MCLFVGAGVDKVLRLHIGSDCGKDSDRRYSFEWTGLIHNMM
jgi:hypothetical protein